MKKPILLFAAIAATTLSWGQDSCDSPLIITAGSYVVPAVNGPEIPDPFCAPNGAGGTSASEWYLYTPAMDLALTITTDLGSGVDTRFHVYTGECGALVCAGGDDDSGSGFSSVTTINVTEGVSYRIAFDNRWTSVGFPFQLIENEILGQVVSFVPVTLVGSGNVQCVVDMNGDMLDDAVSTTNTTVTVNHQQPGGGFVAATYPTPPADYNPSWSIAAGDLDDNGFTDLVYGGGSGATIMMAANDGQSFTEFSAPEYIFSQRTNMVDINNDGILDVFVCHDVAPNVYFIHDGMGGFTFNQGGLGDNGGNYGSIWTDHDNDGDVDLFIAKCGSSPPDVLMQNNGDGTYTNVAGPLGLADGQQSWSSAWGDFDNDGDMDILIGSSSSGPHKLMRNNGNGTYVNILSGSGFDGFGGQSIEWTTHDFNNDGYLDVLGGGAMMMNQGDMTFLPIYNVPNNGPIGDLNNDGFLDIVNGSTAHMNNGNENNYIRVHLTGTISNMDGIGARIHVDSPLGQQIRDVKSGDGFRHMSTITAHFGLAEDTEVYEVTVRWPSGILQTVSGPAINGVLEVVEGFFTSVDDQVIAPGLNIFPNPTNGTLNINADYDLSGHAVSIFDVAGKQVLSTSIQQGRIDVAGLRSGVYLLQIQGDEGMMQQRFVRN